MTDQEPLLAATGLDAGYGDIQVLSGVGVKAWPGRVTAVLGANGAGKTTLLSTIAGLVRNSAGTVEVDGVDVHRMPVYTRMIAGLALVQEGKRVFRRRTVHENLLLGGYRMARKKRADAVEAAYERFPVLRDKRADAAGSLSGGQQQMLAIAQALMPGPRILMLDEPSAGLAPIIVDDLIHTIVRLRAEGMAVVLVEQLVDKARSVSDHITVLQQGRVVIDRPAGDVSEADLREAYLGTGEHRAGAVR